MASSYERYDTERKGSELKTSDSRKRFSRAHDIGGHEAVRRAAAGQERRRRRKRKRRRGGGIAGREARHR